MKRNNILVGFLSLVAITLIIWTIVGWAVYGVYRYYHPCEDRIAPAKVKAMMKYHGVQDAYEDYEGNLYFIRNGQKCRL